MKLLKLSNSLINKLKHKYNIEKYQRYNKIKTINKFFFKIELKIRIIKYQKYYLDRIYNINKTDLLQKITLKNILIVTQIIKIKQKMNEIIINFYSNIVKIYKLNFSFLNIIKKDLLF